MLIRFGSCANAQKSNIYTPIIWDAMRVINGHILILGMSGAGKTFTIKKMIEMMLATKAQSQPVRFHVYDSHGDMDFEGASSVMLSEQTDYGINPLAVNPDRHFGGVRKAINHFIRTLNQSMQRLGVRQEQCMRNLLNDLYLRHGFDPKIPETWTIHDDEKRTVSDGSDNRIYINCPKEEMDSLKALDIGAVYDGSVYSWWVPINNYQGAVTRWPPKLLNRTQPNIKDLLGYARHVLNKAFIGADSETVTHLEVVNRAANAYHGQLIQAAKKGTEFSNIEMREAIHKKMDKAVQAYKTYVESISTGRELQHLLKYESAEMLKAVIGRLESMVATGIFRSKPLPFDERKPIWRYDIRPLGQGPERKMFVLFHIAEIFARNVELGETDRIREVIILDEAHLYSDDDPENPISIIANEARKFGLALIAGSQSPSHFTEDFLASVSTKIILGIDESFWRASATKLNLKTDALEWIIPQRRCLIQIKSKGSLKIMWSYTMLDFSSINDNDMKAYKIVLDSQKNAFNKKEFSEERVA